MKKYVPIANKKALFAKNCDLSSRWRSAVLDRLGRICTKCGFTDERALQIDHKQGGGCAEKKNMGWKYYEKMYDHLEDYQVLCANCNWIKRHERRETPHGK